MSRLNSNLAWKSPLVICVLSSCLLRVTPAQQVKSETSLELNSPVERSIAAGETQSYTVHLTSGQYAHITADQRGVDVVISILAPNGSKLAEVDMPNGNRGVEPAAVIAWR